MWCPQSTNALTWTLRVCRYTHVKLRCNKYGAYSEKQTPRVVKEQIPFANNKRFLNEHKLGHGYRRGSKPRTTVLARTSNKFCTELASSYLFP
jgi:hypothetical protein